MHLNTRSKLEISAQILVPNTIPQWKEPDLFEKWLILGLKVENVQDDPGTFLVPESKEVLKPC